MAQDDLGIAERLRRKMGRPARTRSVATRFTEAEEKDLLGAAEKEGMTLREWTREALLREARRPQEDPIFTEIIATKIFLNNALRALLTGQKMTAEQFDSLTDNVRKSKRRSAKEVLKQYTEPDKL